MSIEQEIATYLQDEKKLYRQWAHLMNELDEDGSQELISMKSSLRELKGRATIWIQDIYIKYHQKLCQLCHQYRICEQWAVIKADSSRVELFIALIVDLKTILDSEFHPSHTVIVSTLIVVHNLLDHLCDKA